MVTQTISSYLKREHNLFYLARVSDETMVAERQNCYYFPSKNKKESIQYYNRLIAELKIDIVINQGPFLPFNPIISNSERDKRVKLFSFVHFAPGFEFERIKDGWRAEKKPLKRIFKRVKTKLGLNTIQYHPDKLRKQYRDLYDVCNNIVVLSPAYINLFKECYRLKECDKLRSIGNPTRYVCEDSAVLSKKKKVVLFVGRLELESKRVDRLLDIWKSIENQSDWTLKIIGDGPHREALERMVQEEKISNVQFLGQQNNIEPFYEEASVIALTSSYEGLSLCFIEAIQYGVVPIAFDVSYGNSDLLKKLSSDLLIEPFNMEKYAVKLAQLMSDKAYRTAIATQAIKNGKEYSLENVGKEWDQLCILPFRL